nr:MAG TPA: hypothetical protein [Bacteriophage sp.]
MIWKERGTDGLELGHGQLSVRYKGFLIVSKRQPTFATA